MNLEATPESPLEALWKVSGRSPSADIITRVLTGGHFLRTSRPKREQTRGRPPPRAAAVHGFAELFPDILALAAQWEEGEDVCLISMFCHNNSLF